MSSSSPKFRRVMLKLSGEALMGDQAFGIDMPTVDRIAADIKQAALTEAQICLVIGGGNIFRGVSGAAKGVERTTADYMGMLATVMNALTMQAALTRIGVECIVQSAIPMNMICESYTHRSAVHHLSRGRVVIFTAGTGNPFFTTDTAAALRAAEMGCDALMKATQVDGVYDSDPKKNPDAKRYDTLSYRDVLAKDLKVMDAAAVSLARDNGIPIVVFSIHEDGSFAGILRGEGLSTVVTGD